MSKFDPRPWLREPLLHFLAIGLLIFALDRFARSGDDDPRLIVIDDAVRAELVALFAEGRGRKPTDKEYEFLVERWLYDEVMYREALALGLDKGDVMFRSRLELKLRAMLINSVQVDPPTEEDLRRWFEANRARYTTPPRFDLVQFPVDGDDPERTASALAATLGGSKDDSAIPVEYEGALRHYKGRSRDNIAAVFGDDFAALLLQGDTERWRALRSEGGWHVAQVRGERPQVAPDFEALKPRIRAEWTKYHNRRLAGEAFEEIRRSYEIRREDRP